MTTSEKPSFVLETPIKTTIEKLWAALTKADHLKAYHFAQASLDTNLEVGGPYDLYRPDGNLMLGGKIIAIDPPRRLESTFEPSWEGPDATPTRFVYEIEERGDECILTISHYGLKEGETGIAEGWGGIARNIKAYLEGEEIQPLGQDA